MTGRYPPRNVGRRHRFLVAFQSLDTESRLSAAAGRCGGRRRVDVDGLEAVRRVTV